MADKKDKDTGAEEKASQKEVLDLLDTSKKKRTRKKAAAAAAEAPVPAEPTPKEPKEEALDLLDPKKKKKPAKKMAKGTDLPPISIIQDEKEKAFQAAMGKGMGKGSPEEPAKEAVEEDTGTEEDAEDDTDEVLESDDPNVIHIKPPVSIEELATRMDLKPFKLIADLIEFGVFANAKGTIEPDIAAQVCEKHGFIFEKEQRKKGGGVHKEEEVVEVPPEPEEEEQEEDQLLVRAPIITFMGHVDHGKTSLLDAIRETNKVDGEAGGITQHIGAYTIEKNGQAITFLDTPGHAAFTRMRARGANVTDIVVLVVAADDGLMPQTREAISHAKAAGSTILVAINKIDLPGADTNKVKFQLQEEELNPVDLGGDIETVDVSATKGTGIDNLLETMLLQAEMLELKANPKLPGRATVIEASLQPGKGPVATVIVNSGTLKTGTPFICGAHEGRVKGLHDDKGGKVKSVGPGMAVEVLGFSELPRVGDEFVEMKSTREAKKLSDQRLEELRVEKLSKGQTNHEKATFEGFIASLENEGPKTLNLLLKTDVVGTAEAIEEALADIKTEKVSLNFLHSGAGAITESDVVLAKASGATVLGFNVKVENKAVAVARREDVEVRLYSIIYELIDQVKETMLGLLDAETREKVLGEAEVKEIFKLARRGRVAGCIVYKGKILGGARARLIRGGQPVYDGGFDTLRRFQDEVKEVKNGLECGIRLGDYREYEVGDIIQCYELEHLESKL